MFALLDAPQRDLAAALRWADWFEVGPTTNGWTPAWWSDPVGPVAPDAVTEVLRTLRSLVPDAVDALVVAETWHPVAGDVDGVVSVVLREAGELVVDSWTPWTAARAPHHHPLAGRTALITALLARFGASAVDGADESEQARALARALSDHDDVPALARALGTALRLPPVEPASPTASLVLHRRRSRASARAVDVAVRRGGPAEVAALDGGWIAYRPGVAADAAHLAHLAGVAAAVDDVVLLQHGPGVSRVEVHRRGHRVEARTADGWSRSDEAGGVASPSAVVDLVGALGVPARAHALLEAPEAAFDETRSATTSARLLAAMLAPGRWRRPGFSPRAGSARR